MCIRDSASAESTRRRLSVSRAVVSSAYSSRLYSTCPVHPPSGSGVRSTLRSNLAVPVLSGTTSSSTAPAVTGRNGASSVWNRCRTSGVRPPASRAGRSFSTRWSNGMSAWDRASSTAERTWRSRSRTVGSPERSRRSGRVLTKNPTRGATSARERPATGMPMTRSRCPDQRPSTAANAVSATTNGVVRSASARAVSARPASGVRVKVCVPPAKVGSAGRAWSAGTSSNGASARRSRQCASCCSAAGEASHSCCQAA